MNIEQKIKEAITKLSFSSYSPVFTNLILMTKFKYVGDKELPNAGAGVVPKSDGVYIYINSDLMKDFSIPTLTSILAHEYWHIINGHCWYRLSDLIKDNIAADIEINQKPYVELGKIGCDGSDLDPEFEKMGMTYHKFNLPNSKSREFYYENLPQSGNGNRKSKGQGYGSQNNKNNKNNPKQGQNGDGQQQVDSRQQVDSHNYWDEADTKNSKEIYKRIVEEILEHVKNKGILPGNVVEEIKARWAKNRTLEQVLKRIIGKHYRDSLNETVTRTRPSRRNPLVPGTKNSYGPMFVFAIDTSGSMSTEMLEELISVFKWVAKKFGPMPLIQCDAEVHDLIKDISHKTTIAVKGRGGTDFKPVFEFIEKKFKNKIDALIFGTDLEGSYPKLPPPYKVYWVVKDNNKKPPFGTVIRL